MNTISGTAAFNIIVKWQVIGFTLLFLTGQTSHAVERFETRQIELKGQGYQLEIASTFAQRLQGLMHRTDLAIDEGMLFVYQRTGNHRIWMKNTLIPLTVIWLDSQARILAVKRLKPCYQQDCPVFSAGTETRYILELHETRASEFSSGEILPGLLGWINTQTGH